VNLKKLRKNVGMDKHLYDHILWILGEIKRKIYSKMSRGRYKW